MSSNNNNTKKNDDAEGKKKKPTDTLDVKKPPALLTHCVEEESSVPVEKRLIAGKSRTTMQMKKKLASTSSEKDDQDSSSYAISGNMSRSDIITLRDLQNSMDKSSYAVAATPATASQYHSHQDQEAKTLNEIQVTELSSIVLAQEVVAFYWFIVLQSYDTKTMIIYCLAAVAAVIDIRCSVACLLLRLPLFSFTIIQC